MTSLASPPIASDLLPLAAAQLTVDTAVRERALAYPDRIALVQDGRRQTADQLFGRDYVWSMSAAGKKQMPFASMGAVMGANVRVGLEVSLYLEHGRLATSKAEQVSKVRSILDNIGLEVASPSEAREMLKLKGRNNESFT